MKRKRNFVRSAKGEKMDTTKCNSPCETCTRVQDPKGCENKNCGDWRMWFLRRWAAFHRYSKVYGKERRG